MRCVKERGGVKRGWAAILSKMDTVQRSLQVLGMRGGSAMDDDSGELVIFQEAGQAVEVRLDAKHDTVWLTQKLMADLFETSTDNVSLHLKNIFADGELSEAATTEDSSVVRQEGKRQVSRSVKHYNLDAIISVGYRVRSKRAVLFRQWATKVLREHLTRGYTLNQQRFERNARELEAALQLVCKAAERARTAAQPSAHYLAPLQIPARHAGGSDPVGAVPRGAIIR